MALVFSLVTTREHRVEPLTWVCPVTRRAEATGGANPWAPTDRIEVETPGWVLLTASITLLRVPDQLRNVPIGVFFDTGDGWPANVIDTRVPFAPSHLLNADVPVTLQFYLPAKTVARVGVYNPLKSKFFTIQPNSTIRAIVTGFD